MVTEAVNTGKYLGFPCLLVDLSFLGESSMAGGCWLWGELSPCAAGNPTCFPPGPRVGGWLAQNQGTLTAEVNIGFKVNENS